jgi:hydroxyacylglutathione hydrolase
MIIERSLQPQWQSNTYLVAGASNEAGVIIDAGGPVKPLIEFADTNNIKVTHILLTHHHVDHVAELDKLLARWPQASVLTDAAEAAPALSTHIGQAEVVKRDETLTIDGLKIQALHTPGHTAGMLSFLVNENAVFTGDTLFRESVGGLRAPGHTTFSDLKNSIMNVLMTLPPSTDIYPGHTEATTVGHEYQSNPFIRIWRGLDPEGSEKCQVNGEECTLILLARDYDGGKKAWVRYRDGRDDIVAGSMVGFK